MYKTNHLNTRIKTLMVGLLLTGHVFISELQADILNGSHWIIKPGDSLYKIARNIFPDNTKKQALLREALIKQNPRAFRNGAANISVGDKLQLPDFAIKQEKPTPVIAAKKPQKIIAKPAAQKALETDQMVTPDPEDIIGQVIINVGELSAQNRGSTRNLNRRSSLYRGDTLVTGARSLTQIRLKDGALLSLRPHTELKLAEYRYNGQQDGSELSIVELIKGGFRTITGVIGHKNKNNYQVRTTVATIGIRGTHYSLVLCQQASCSDDETGAVEDGLYGGVADGSIVIENQTGIHRFNNDQYFQLTSASTKPVEFLLPPAILKHGAAKSPGASKKARKNISKRTKTAPRRLAVIFEANQPDFTKSPKVPVNDVDVPAIAEFIPDKAPVGSGMLIGFNERDNTTTETGTAASVIIAPNNNNVIFLGPNRTPIAGREASVDQQTGELVQHEIIMVSPSGTLANLVPSSIGGNPALGVNWGRWNGDFVIKEDGVALNTGQDFHYIYSENLTPMSQSHLATLGGLKGTSVFYTAAGGTLPTDHTGAPGSISIANMSVDFINQEITNYSIDVNVGVNNYYATLPFGTTIPFHDLTDSFNIESSTSGCPSFTGCTGEASVIFLGNEAQGAISSYHIDDNDGRSSVTGTLLLTEDVVQQ
ncbi:MAG: FecR domain-containing protein [Gammaproteobacteria bacterium]|nr:FecR domain-containing protein [Gammaproteobacteria bacterium]